jgi:hypothetical protein
VTILLPTSSGSGAVKLSLRFNWAPRHEGVLEEWSYCSTHSLALALDGGEWSASRPGRFIPRERAPDTHWVWGWVGYRAVVDAVVKRKIPSSRRESNPRTPIFQPVAQRYTDWAITVVVFRVLSKIYPFVDLIGTHTRKVPRRDEQLILLLKVLTGSKTSRSRRLEYIDVWFSVANWPLYVLQFVLLGNLV